MRHLGINISGNTPKGWEKTMLKSCLFLQNGQDYKHVESDNGYPVIGSGGQFRYASEYLYDGEAILLGRKGTLDKPLYVNYAFWTVDTMFYGVPIGHNCGKFIYYLSIILPFDALKTNTALPSMTQTALNTCFIVIPPKNEQIAIASYLDEKCGKIDAIVATLRQLADKYTSLKRSLINETVCRGLDKNVTLKPSGIDWIGDIPEHWTVERLSNCIRETSTGFWGEEEKNNEFDRVCLRIADFDYEHGNISLKKLTYRNIDEEHYNCRRLEKGDLLIEKSGGGDIWPVGRTVRFLLDIEATFTNFIMQIKINDKNNSNYIYYYLHFVYSLGISRMYFDQTIGIQNLDVIGYLRQVMCLPPKSEQQAIATYLDEKCGKIDAIVDNINAQIESYKKLKKSLINDVVTGKRRVI